MKRIFLIFLFILCSIMCCGQTYPVNYRDHNEINTCKNLLQKYTLDELSTMISTGNFDDIYVGDYIEYDTAIENAFGSSHILSYHQFLTTSTNTSAPSMAGNNYTGCSNNWAWSTGATNMPHVTKLNLMNEVQLYGTKVLSSSFYDIGINNSQFPLFAQIPELIPCGRGFNKSTSSRSTYWLSSVASTIGFARCAEDAVSSQSSANSEYFVRPYFLFK